MCGIVAYFGGAGNNLTRILTAMSAIIYRAPDSTGVGFLGDDVNPLRVRKSLGSAAGLIPVLLDDPTYPNPTANLLSVFTAESGGTAFQDLQQRLLEFEGFPPDIFDALLHGRQSYPSFDDLVELDPSKARRIAPGFPGRPTLADDLRIRSRKDLQKVIQHLIATYDLSPLVIQILIRRALAETLRQKQSEENLEIIPADVLGAFDRLFDQCLSGEQGPRPQRMDYDRFPKNPYVQKYLWRYLIETPVEIPADFDRDGVRCVFRLLDAALLSRLPHNSWLEESLNETLKKLWPKIGKTETIDWKTLYKTEKAVNLYGWAAGTALAFLQQEEFISELHKNLSSRQRSNTDPPAASGQTDPVCLRYFASPVISHGRWSIQAPVTLENAHPFFDERKQRLIALNGKFDANLESELREFLKRVGGISFRSENSSEYLALLWGYYYHQLKEDKQRFETIKSQVEAGFEKISIGSQAIDYQLYHRVQAKSAIELDAMAFIEATRQIIRQGGQVAATGISLLSPRRIYVASHNRPIFIVRRLENDDFMVVSDINAAMGLFPHALIQQRTLELVKLEIEKNKTLQKLKASGDKKEKIQDCELNFNQKEAKLLEVFKVAVYPLVGEKIFAQIITKFEGQMLRREVNISDFDGNPLPEIESTLTILHPPAIRKDLYRSYYESHLHEIPERMTEILNTYLPENKELPEFQVREDLFHRHFGPKLTTLRRIVLVGVAGAYNMATIARSFVRKLIPNMEILVLMPCEVDDLLKIIDPDTDMVVLLCWSATTADMVAFARRLQTHKTVMIAITEKIFADMALMAQKSGGVIPVLSGEEVTITGIKSTLCMLFCLYLFTIWLACQKGRSKVAITYLKKLQRVPEIVSQVIADEILEAFSKHLASQSAQSYAAIVADALDTFGTGREVASKLEEMSWNAIGSPIDYQDFQTEALVQDLNKNLILINATSKGRFREALGLMNVLYEKGFPFAAVTYSNRELTEIKRYTRNNAVCLPKIEDVLQPFVDLVFYYRLAFHYGLAHGRNAEDFPRNRVKSVTASRSSPRRASSTAEELLLLQEKNQITTDSSAKQKSVSKASSWEVQARFDWEKKYYREMRRLAQVLHRPDPLDMLMELSDEASSSLVKIISDIISKEGEILFIPFDLTALAAVRNIVTNWRRILGCRLKIVDKNFVPNALSDNSLFFSVGTKKPDEELLFKILQKNASRFLWIGPSLTKALEQIFQRSAGCCILKSDFSCNRADVLYAGVSLLLAHCWKSIQSSKAETVQKHLIQASSVIAYLLNNVSIKNSLGQTMQANRDYKTAFFVGPPVGTGLFWTKIFKQTESLILEFHLFGESVHGPIVTVDSQIENKFVKLENRKQMVLNYGKDNLAQWERDFLGRTKIDHFLNHAMEDLSIGSNRPFFAEGNWYLPVLRNDYDSAKDNLIIIDATSRRYFTHAIDELATYGCRYARMIVLSQEAFQKDAEKKLLYQYPISHLIELPGLNGNNGEIIPISDFLLPFGMNLLGVAMASAAAEQAAAENPG
jgi:glucosamine 6-phosphate synthetase-like amidotransferase/phosphosugar isomerase protein